LDCLNCKTEMHYIGDSQEYIGGANVRVYVEICPQCESDVQIMYKKPFDKEILYKVIWRAYE